MNRKIIRIDESKCTGCGLCIPNCAEGSLEIRDGKAVLVKEALCDGLGACLGHCPEGALIIEEREAEPFDEKVVEERLREIGRSAPSQGAAAKPASAPHGQGSCPSARPLAFGGCPSARAEKRETASPREGEPSANPSELGHWPVQLGLLPPTAPFFQGADLLLTADCVPFAYPDFHRDLLRGRAVAVACPKLDDADAHYRKLVDLFRYGGVKSVTVARMEVPCCGGLAAMTRHALKESGSSIPMREIVVGRHGEILFDSNAAAETDAA